MAKEKEAPERIGTQGWEQFLASKQEMLYQYDLAKVYAESHIVKVSHGNVAEAVFRKWLASFLPAKYGVTAGYIVSQNNNFININLPHYDVIIYDKLNSPVLWVEENPSNSDTGNTRAIPAEYVCAIIEVKANITVQSSKNSLKKIYEIKPLLRGMNIDSEYDGFLSKRFFAATVFFEIKSENEFKVKILDNIISKMDIPYYGGIILRGETRDINDSGLFKMLVSASPFSSTVGEDNESIIKGSPFSNSVQTPDQQYAGTMITWSPANFSFFAFDLIALLEGKYKAGHISSKLGISWRNPNRKKQ